MRQLLLTIFLIILFVTPSFADETLSAQTELTSPTSDDLMYIVDNDGTPNKSRKITVENLFNWFVGEDWTLTGTWDFSGATVTGVQNDLDLVKGTYTDGYLCTYTDSGTVLDCNTDPASLLTSVDLSTVTISGGTENSIAIWDGSGNLTGDTTPALGTPSAIVLTNATGLPLSSVVDSTSEALGVGTLEIGHASDTTLTRQAAGIATIEGNVIGGALTPVIGDADDFDDNFTGVNLYGGTYIVSGAGTIILPDATAGMNFTIVLEGAVATIIDPLGTGTADTIYMNGLAAASDENITSSTRGAMCVFQYRAANTWMATCNGFAEATPP